MTLVPSRRLTTPFAALRWSGLGVCVLCVWLLPTFSNADVLIAIVLLLGVPHGALDFSLARAQLNPKRLAIYCALYVAVLAGALALMYLLPALAVGASLVLAVNHFGQSALLNQWPWYLRHCAATALGSLPILASVRYFYVETNAIFNWMMPAADAATLMQTLSAVAQVLWPLLGAGIVMLGILCVLTVPGKPRKSGIFSLLLLEICSLIGAVGIHTLLTPLPAFTVYFCLIHAPQHTATRIQNLEATWRRSVVEAYVMTALAVALVLLAGTFGVFQQHNIGLLFLGLLAITVPHALSDGLIKYLRG